MRAPCADLQRVRQLLLDCVAGHEAVCGEPELFFSQSEGQLTVVCVSCGLQGAVFQ